MRKIYTSLKPHNHHGRIRNTSDATAEIFGLAHCHFSAFILCVKGQSENGSISIWDFIVTPVPRTPIHVFSK